MSLSVRPDLELRGDFLAGIDLIPITVLQYSRRRCTTNLMNFCRVARWIWQLASALTFACLPSDYSCLSTRHLDIAKCWICDLESNHCQSTRESRTDDDLSGHWNRASIFAIKTSDRLFGEFRIFQWYRARETCSNDTNTIWLRCL